MKKIYLFAVIICVLTSCTNKITDSLDWQHNKVMVDGKISEWPNPLRFYESKSGINYSISNDRKNLFLCMKVADEQMQKKILQGGMEFRIDTLGKKSFPVIFRFPVENQVSMARQPKSENREEPEMGGKPNRLEFKQRMLNRANEAFLVGFKSPLQGMIHLPNSALGIAAAINIDSLGIMYYEAEIPFKTFFKNELLPVDSTRAFSYEIKVNGLPAAPAHEGNRGDRNPDQPEMGGNRPEGGRMPGEMHGSHHGGFGEGGMHGGEGNATGNSELNQPTKITKKLNFSYK